jgi:hypothetical protein
MGIAPHQPFRDIRAITHEFAPQAWASVRMSGETFEMEDHRNWSDASFKTYCTPIDLPFPVEVRPGDTIWQGATVAVDIEDVDIAPFDDAVGIHLLDDVAPLPALGLQVAADEVPAVAQLGKLRSLGLDHLRLDLRSSDPDAKDRIADAAVQAAAIGARLIVAATIEDPADLFALATSVDVVDTWLVFDAHAKTTGRPLVAAARAALGAQARIGGGTNLYFAELNREPVDPTGLAVVAFSMNPQVHAADDATVVQNLAAQEVVVLNAGRIAGATPLLVGPVTLRPRFNPNATAPEVDASSTALPANVDARQVSPLAACWTAMSLKYLAEAGTVSAITFFETVGWRGVMERAEGSRQPADFPSTPGMVFPLYEILAAARGFTRVRLCQADNAARVDALVFEDDSGRRRVIVANFTDCEQDVPLVGFGPDLTHARLDPCGFAILDGRTAP